MKLCKYLIYKLLLEQVAAMDCKAFNRLFKTIWCNYPTSEKVHEYTNINVNDFPGVGRVISKKLDYLHNFKVK